MCLFFFFFSSRRRHTRFSRDWSSDVCSSDLLGDEGSGFWIGQEALRAGFWAKDRGITTRLLIEIGAFWGTGSLGEIVEKANERPSPDFAALTPIVVKCAEAGDELAIAVLERAGAELAEQVALVALKMTESGGN